MDHIKKEFQYLVHGYSKKINKLVSLDVMHTITLFYAKPVAMKLQNKCTKEILSILCCPIEDEYEAIISKINKSFNIPSPESISSIKSSLSDKLLPQQKISIFEWDSDELFIVNNVCYFDLAAIKFNGYQTLHKIDFPSLDNKQFIDKAIEEMATNVGIKAFVVVYQSNAQQNISRINFKYSLETAYDKPHTMTGQQVFVFEENLNETYTKIGKSHTIW